MRTFVTMQRDAREYVKKKRETERQCRRPGRTSGSHRPHGEEGGW